MSITFTCPNCGKQYRLSEELIGKRVRCAACQTQSRLQAPPVDTAHDVVVELDSEEAQRPRRRPRDEDEDDYSDRPPPKRTPPHPAIFRVCFWLIALPVGFGIFGLLVVAYCGLTIYRCQDKIDGYYREMYPSGYSYSSTSSFPPPVQQLPGEQWFEYDQRRARLDQRHLPEGSSTQSVRQACLSGLFRCRASPQSFGTEIIPDAMGMDRRGIPCAGGGGLDDASEERTIRATGRRTNWDCQAAL